MKVKINNVFKDTFNDVSRFRRHKVKTTILNQLKNWQNIEHINLSDLPTPLEVWKKEQNKYITNYLNFIIMKTNEKQIEKLVDEIASTELVLIEDTTKDTAKVEQITQDNAKEIRRNTKESIIANCLQIVGNEFKSYLLSLDYDYILSTPKAEEIDARFIDVTKQKQDFVIAFNSKFASAKKEIKHRQIAEKYVKEAQDAQLFAFCNNDKATLKEVKKIAKQLDVDALEIAKFVAVADAMQISLLDAVQRFRKVEDNGAK